MKKRFAIPLFIGALCLFVTVTPLMVAIEECRAEKRIKSGLLLVDPDFATCYFYDELCKERNLTNENTCKQATQTLKSYWQGRRNIKIYGY